MFVLLSIILEHRCTWTWKSCPFLLFKMHITIACLRFFRIFIVSCRAESAWYGKWEGMFYMRTKLQTEFVFSYTSQLIHMDVLLRHCACISIAVKLFVCMRSSDEKCANDLIRVIIKVSSGMRDRQQNTEQTQYSTAVANTQKIIHCQTERLFL